MTFENCEAEIRKDERERIIKIIENEIKWYEEKVIQAKEVGDWEDCVMLSNRAESLKRFIKFKEIHKV